MESLRAIAKAIKKYPVAIPAKGSSVSIHPGLFPTSMSDFKNDRPSKKEGESKEQYDDKFEQTVRKEYLSALQLPYLARLNPRNESYDYKSAHSFTNGIQSTLRRKNAQNVMFSLSGQSVAKLISVLLQLTKTPLPLPEESRIFPREVFTDIPAITEDIVKDERLFSDYIALISHSEFHFRGSSRQRGIIPKLLRNLLHPSNLRTASLKSASAFNDAIYYFGKKYDFATCRELYAQMKSEGISPVSYTHLDVYKRQEYKCACSDCANSCPKLDQLPKKTCKIGLFPCFSFVTLVTYGTLFVIVGLWHVYIFRKRKMQANVILDEDEPLRVSEDSDDGLFVEYATEHSTVNDKISEYMSSVVDTCLENSVSVLSYSCLLYTSRCV